MRTIHHVVPGAIRSNLEGSVLAGLLARDKECGLTHRFTINHFRLEKTFGTRNFHGFGDRLPDAIDIGGRKLAAHALRHIALNNPSFGVTGDHCRVIRPDDRHHHFSGLRHSEWMLVDINRKFLRQGLSCREPIQRLVQRVGPGAVSIHAEAAVFAVEIGVEEIRHSIFVTGIQIAGDLFPVFVDIASQVTGHDRGIIRIANKNNHVLAVSRAQRIGRHHGDGVVILDLVIGGDLESHLAIGTDRESVGIGTGQRPVQGVAKIPVSGLCGIDNRADIRVFPDCAEDARRNLRRVVGAINGHANLLRRTIERADGEGVGMRRPVLQFLDISVGNPIRPVAVAING